MLISQTSTVELNHLTEKLCDTADELLEYRVGNDRFQNVITQVAQFVVWVWVWSRSAGGCHILKPDSSFTHLPHKPPDFR